MTNTNSMRLPAPGSSWGWVLAYGILVMLIGILALYNPIATGFATGILFGALLIVYGVFALVSGISGVVQHHRWVEILLGVLAILAGIVVLVMPLSGAWSLVWALGFWLAVSGVFQIVTAIRIAFNRGWRLFLGIVDVVLGAILLLADPASSLLYLAAIVGISFLFRGSFLVVLSLAMRRLAHTLSA